MDIQTRTLCDKALSALNARTLGDVLAAIPTFMLHIDQEPDVHGTYTRPFPGQDAQALRKVYHHYEELIASTPLSEYLQNAGAGQCLPCKCPEIATVAGHLAAVLLSKPIHRIGRVTPRYLKGKAKSNRFQHYLDCFQENGAYRFFDASVYARIWDDDNGKWVPSLPGFDRTDIDFQKFIDWKGWTQKSPKPRVINPSSIIPTHRIYGDEKFFLRIAP